MAGDMYQIASAVVPLYGTLFIGWLASRFRVLDKVAFGGLNRFIVVFCLPAIIFRVLARANLYAADMRIFAVQTIYVVLCVMLLGIWALSRRNKGGDTFGYFISFLSISSFPNSLIIGVPILNAMYGTKAEIVMILIVVYQSV
eukprot:Colp12_sorted_trinity150504_noHs@31653